MPKANIKILCNLTIDKKGTIWYNGDNQTKGADSMKNRTKRNICHAILAINALVILGLTGACELGDIGVFEYAVKITIVFFCSIIPMLKSGLLK